MKNLSQQIKKVENKWQNILYRFCLEKFKQVNIPSHDHLHHYRVWLFARKLFHELQEQKIKINDNDIEKAIIAIFFHDIGLTFNPDQNHGKKSREICELFIKENKEKNIIGQGEILDAIDKHDDKKYKGITYRKEFNISVLSTLSICDDLDAFGYIGVLRYAEIYIIRNIPVINLAKNVLKNLESRYANFISICSGLDEFLTEQTKRYYLTKDFYNNLEDHLKYNKYSPDIIYGPTGVINYFIKYVINKNLPLLKMADHVLTLSRDKYIYRFFSLLKEEIESFNYPDLI